MPANCNDSNIDRCIIAIITVPGFGHRKEFPVTKPTGEGTGLGLSLAYDMVKAHGEISENSKEGEWTEFVVVLLVS